MATEYKDMNKIQLMVELLKSRRDHTESLNKALDRIHEWETLYKENNQEKTDMIDNLMNKLGESIETSQDLIHEVKRRDVTIASYEDINLN